MLTLLNFTDFFSWINLIFSYRPFLIILFSLLSFFKILLFFVANRYRQQLKNQTPLILFMVSLTSYTLGEFAWILKLFEYEFVAKTLGAFVWHMQPIQFYSLSLFLLGISKENYLLSEVQKRALKVLCFFIPFPLIGYIIDLFSIKIFSNIFLFHSFLEPLFFRVSVPKQIILGILGMIFLIVNMIIVSIKTRCNKTIPYLLRLQIQSFLILLSTFVIPEFALVLCYFITPLNFLLNNLPFTALSSTLFTASLMFYARKIYQLRFLNLMPAVASSAEKTNNSELRRAKQALCTAQSVGEIQHINTEFFEKTYGISSDRAVFVLRVPELQKQINNLHNDVIYDVESFIHKKYDLAMEFFTEDSVLVYDELAFTYFYEQSEKIAALLSFLKKIGAAVFIPLKQSDRIVGYVMIKKHPTRDELFPLSIQTQMGLYGTYVTYAIMRLEQYQYKELLIEKEKLSVELSKVNQKVARYQESFSTIVSADGINKHGIMVYKSGIFTFVNTAAENLVQINPNTHFGHPLYKALKEIVRRVTEYGNPHAIIEKNMLGLEIHCHGFPYKNGEVFILVSLADIMNTLKIEHVLVRPSDIDYLVFLYSTDDGMLLNTALPGKGDVLQKFKLQFLRTILGKKSMVFDIHPDDLNMFLHVMQRILKRQTLYTIDVQETPSFDAICKKLFGSQTFNTDSMSVERGLLDRLDESGILCIQNAHLLDLKTQELLVQYMKTGSFTMHKSEQRVSSNAIIVLSTRENLAELSKNGFFSKTLFGQVQDAIVSFEPLALLPFVELEMLAEGLQKQMISVAEYHHLFGFSPEELEELNTKRACSIHELQQQIRTQLKHKMKRSPVAEEMTISSRPAELDRSPEKNIADPLLVEAARLGKRALRDRKIMKALWDKLQSQSKIAQLLDVDRSSVHRRFKEFGLGIQDNSLSDVH